MEGYAEMECEDIENYPNVKCLVNEGDKTKQNQLDIKMKGIEQILQDDEGSICPICLDSWTISGAHRLCCLKCGHLFGHECVLRWFNTQTKKTCPTCKKSVKKSELRFIYAKRLIAVDNKELENVKEQLQEVIAEKNKSLQDISKYIAKEQFLQQEIVKLRKEIDRLKRANDQSYSALLTKSNNFKTFRFHMEKKIEICNKNGCRDCRVFDISVMLDQLLIASRTPTDLFGGFGLKKMSLSTYKSIKFIPLHKESIRDMCFHPKNKQVLTVSTDKMFKITDTDSDKVLSTSNLESAPWACAWCPKSSNDFFIGSQNGITSIFDIRNVQTPKIQLGVEGDFSPVVSVAGIDGSTLLVAKLNSVWAFKIDSGSSKKYLLPLEGPFLSLKYDSSSNNLLLSSRPNSQINFARHTLSYLEKIQNPECITSKTMHVFKCGSSAKLLAKTSCFVSDNIVAGFNETRKHIIFYSANNGDEVGLCPINDNIVLDMKCYGTSSANFLAYLNEKKLEILTFSV